MTTNLNIGAFSNLFRDTTNSYKYLFFLAILERIEQDAKEGKVTTFIPLIEVVSRALRFGWYPHRFFRLSFGAHDQVAGILDDLVFDIPPGTITNPSTANQLYSAISSQFLKIRAAELLRYVPYRLIAPFFKEELKGVRDSRRDRHICELAHASFNSVNPSFYRITPCGSSIELHLDWCFHIATNFKVIRSWVLLEFSRFLQKRNPDIPAITSKLEPPKQRGSMRVQTEFWREILDKENFQCIYSDNTLRPESFHLDHFLPWSFVCHDELWNLIPADPSANSSKGNNLPSETEVTCFIATQCRALVISRKVIDSESIWLKKVQAFSVGLSLSPSDLLLNEQINAAYRRKLSPLLGLASQLGY